MNDKKWMIHQNLAFLRKSRQLSLEEVAERVGVSRQAVGKWESGETVPDIVNCDALAELYNVSVDDLLHYDGGELKLGPGPRGKHIFGITVMGERGQVVIPKQARELFQLKPRMQRTQSSTLTEVIWAEHLLWLQQATYGVNQYMIRNILQ